MKIPAFFSLAFWCLSLASTSAEIVINEIMYGIPREVNTPEATNEEFIEILNTGNETVSLTGWEIDAGVSYTFPATSIAPNEYLVVSASPFVFVGKYPEVSARVLGPWTGRLSNSGEKIRLRNSLGEEVDELTYADQGDWAQRRRGPLDNNHRGWVWESNADGKGGSLELVNPSVTNRAGQNWQASEPGAETPGAVNGAFSPDAAPLILEVKHSPTIPTASDRVVITADLRDIPGESLAAFLSYGTDSNSRENRTELPMFDDGLNGDGDAGDGTFGVTLPAFPDGTVVDFFIIANDGNASRTWPAPSDDDGSQGANALFQVEDTSYLSDQDLPVYRLILSPAEHAEFTFGRFNHRSNAQMNATFIHRSGDDTDVRYLAGIRRRGAASRRRTPRTMRLTLANDRPWQETSEMNLNAQFNYLQLFGQKMFEASRVVSAKARAVDVVVNGRKEANSGRSQFGAYVHIEPQGSDSVARQFPDDPGGSLYSSRRPDRKLAFRNGNISQYLADGWTKESNGSEADWSDLDSWLGALQDTSNPDYLTNLETVMDVDQWLRWFAVMTMLANAETNISNGTDDDAYVYAGRLDRRIKAVPHDLDTILGLGEFESPNDPELTIYDMIERGDRIAAFETFLKQPSVLQKYHQALRDLIEGPFSKKEFDLLLANCLGERVPVSVSDKIITFMDLRREFVLGEIGPDLSVTTTLPLISGIPTSNSANADLSGTIPLTNATDVLVNGQAASIDSLAGTWTFTGEILNPGMNRVVVEALDADGTLVEDTSLEIWYDDGDQATLSGTLASDTTLTAAGGPYLVDTDLTVPLGVTLTIESGASLIFGQGVRLSVFGKLDASGSKYSRIQFGVAPGSGETWDGLVFSNSSEDNRLAFVDQSDASAAAQSIEVNNSRLTLDHVQWRSTTKTVLRISQPQVEVSNCHFPATDGNDVISGSGLSGDQFLTISGNTFESSIGYNDIISFTGGRRPGPIIQVIGNIFEGSSDDCLDLNATDAHIEGNIFQNVHVDSPDRTSTANAISADGESHLTIVRNVFEDIDHALLLVNESDAIFENNVVVETSLGAISFREPQLPGVAAGSGLHARGNIFLNNATTFRFPDHPRSGGGTAVIEADQNIMPETDPVFADPENGDYRLLPGSPAIGTGINGQDIGTEISTGASISGEPPLVTDQKGAVLTVHVPGISGIEDGSFTTEYRWRINGGPWSADTDIAQPITLTNLATGTYQIEVLGKNSAGIWQKSPTVSEEWTVVNFILSSVRINEVVADQSAGLDWVELYNPRSFPFDLSGMTLTDDPIGMTGLTFPEGTTLAAKGYRQVFFGLSFGLDRDGESLFLFNNNTLIDSVTFGHQLTDFSLSRLGREGLWGLGKMTPANANEAAGTGNPTALKINEWVANPEVVICDDFVELFNPGTLPVSLGGLFLSENPAGSIRQHEIPPHTFVDAGGFVALDFSMSSDTRGIALSSGSRENIDFVSFTSQVGDTSFARLPDGSGSIRESQLPTPGRANENPGITSSTAPTSLVALDSVWKYDNAGLDRGTAWREVDFDDSDWSSGPGLLGHETSTLPAPGIQTDFGDPRDQDPFAVTSYFRSEFNFTGDLEKTRLLLSTIMEEGGAIYLNDKLLHREALRENATFNTFADLPADARFVGPYRVPADALVSGRNVIAAEVHQITDRSPDIVFGLALDAVETTFIPGVNPGLDNALDLMANLRITEVMYDPSDGTAFEFIELQNIGNTLLQLEGVRFTDGIEFTFPQMTLAPGAFVLLVSDRDSFESKYGVGLPVAGEYRGKLSNGGEEIALTLPAPFDGNIQKFTYNDSWYPLSDGNGAALEIRDRFAPVREWDNRLAWRTGPIEGTPGNDLSISAGVYQTVLVNQMATLTGSVTGNWSPALSWRLVSGPAFVNFTDANSASTSVAFTIPGTYRFRFNAIDDDTELTSEVSVAVDDRYDLWAAREGIESGALDDPEGDGFVNLMEYALDLDPSAKDGADALPIIDGDFRYTRFLRKSDIVYELESSTGLDLWATDTDTLLTATPDQQLRSYRLRGEDRKFIRLRVRR